MAPSLPSKQDPSLSDGEKQKQMDQEIRDMVSALTNRLESLQKSQKRSRQNDEEDEDEDEEKEDDHGVRIITLAGNNVGAVMRGEMEEKPAPEGLSTEEQEGLSTYVNSNFQAVNNSIMLGGEYSTHDPGVHLDIGEYAEHQARPSEQEKMREKKGKGISMMRLTP